MWFRRKKDVSLEQFRELTKAVTMLREDLDDLYDRHERLRGKFYGTRKPENHSDSSEANNPATGTSSDPTSASARLSKSELLARYWLPGRPALHSGGK
jgi:hypothetical protein